MDNTDNAPKISITVYIDDMNKTRVKAAEPESVVIIETEAETVS